MSFFPFFKDIEGLKGLIAGGGRVALRKAEKMLPYGPKLTIIAPEILPELRKLDVTVLERKFCDSDITGELAFVIAACDDESENKRISQLCREMDIPVNVVDRAELCTFLFPSLVKRGELSVGISTSGSSPSAAAWLRSEIERILPTDIDKILDDLRSRRPAVKALLDDEKERSLYFRELFMQSLKPGIGRAEKEKAFHGENKGRVSLVGAGCGGREWIALEGLETLRGCDAVVYDDLIDTALLDEAPAYADRIYAGKRSHKPSADQDDIKKLLVTLARENKHVVRLKGGDPFVFGRGGEEIQYLNENDIPWKLIPGISSAMAIPAEAGIPVTHRGVSRSVHIMTAHTREDVLRKDLRQFAGLEGTLVFLMGLESLETIADTLMENGRGKNTPAAVLSGGNSERPYKVIGTLGDIADRAKLQKVTSPAVIVIGDVVSLDLRSGKSFPLSGVKVGLTGTRDFQAKLREKLKALGAEVFSVTQGRHIETEAAIPWDEITSAREKWIAFSSGQGVRSFFKRARENRIDARSFSACKFAVIGAATGEELEKYGFTADLCPSRYTSEELADELLRTTDQGEYIYLFCSAKGSERLPEKLTEAGRNCHRFDIYDTYFSRGSGYDESPQYMIFGSAGGVSALRDMGYRYGDNCRGICIGPVCADAYRKCFDREPIVSEASTAESLTKALMEHNENRKNTKKEVDNI